jgi:cytochrome bd-type quinol oxidase subunit 2
LLYKNKKMNIIKNLKANATKIAVVISILSMTGVACAAVNTMSDIVDIIVTVARWIRTIFFVVAAIFILMAAFGYLTSGGNEDKVKSAKNQLIYAVVAIVIALLAFVMGDVINSIIQPGYQPEPTVPVSSPW